MSELPDFILEHTRVVQPKAGDCVDLVFFGVKPVGSPEPERLRALVKSHQANEVQVFDQQEHSYLELGAWLGSQELALRLMGLGAALGLWKLLSPRTVMGNLIGEELVQQMAGNGYITVLARENAGSPLTAG